MVELRTERVHGPARRAIANGLRRYNTAHVGQPDFHRLTITVRDRRRIVGGIVAEAYYGWMEVILLWIDEGYRGQGIGRTLIERAEAEARARGVTRIYLDTFSFQAPGFYKKMGFRGFGRLDDSRPATTGRGS